MHEREFWDVIERHRGNAEAIAAELARRPVGEIAAWHATYYALHNRLHRGELWDVVDIVYGSLYGDPSSDDSFHYFKAWLIGKGREAYETALKDPDALGAFTTPADLEGGCDNESLNYAAEKAWEAAGRDSEELDRDSNEMDPTSGDRCEPEDWPQRYPRLVERFGPCRW